MDSLSCDNGYSSYSDASTPRTPSPHMLYPNHQQNFKLNVPDHDPVRNIFAEHDDGVVSVPDHPYWNNSNNSPHPSPFAFNNSSRGSLLQELYEPEISNSHHIEQDSFRLENSPSDASYVDHWQQIPHSADPQQNSSRPHDFQMMRRATFPYVRHDREDGVPSVQYNSFIQQQQQQHQQHEGAMLHPYSSRNDILYGEPLPISQEHSPLSSGDSFIPSMSNSPHSSYHEFDDPNIKLEDTPMIVPSQTSYFRSPNSLQCHPTSMSYLSPHTGLPVQHTDDAASKETQYLRRRCFNCHTTEPPSWRRSTLNPGKIVCNKCGLYERTHLRPRPLRFDELRAGKVRKQSKGALSPKTKTSLVKKEPRDYAIVRRGSVSSSSSVHSGSGASDWDDNVSVYSTGSAPPTSFNSPNIPAFPLARDSTSPPNDGGIRLPNAPLSDIASLQQNQVQQQQAPQPRKAHTALNYLSPQPNGTAQMQSEAQEYFMRASQEVVDGVHNGNVWSEAGANVGIVPSPVPTPVAS